MFIVRKIFLLLALCLSFVSFAPPVEAFGGAIGIVIKEGQSGWCDPYMLKDDDPLRQDVIRMAKKYAPYGYNIICNQTIDSQYMASVFERDDEKGFARTYGYDFLIVITIDAFQEPDTIHYRNKYWGEFDIYDADASVGTRMADIHCDKQSHHFALGSSYRSKQGETKKYAVQQALLKAIDGALDYYGDKMKEDLEAEAKASQPAIAKSNDFYGQWYKGD